MRQERDGDFRFGIPSKEDNGNNRQWGCDFDKIELPFAAFIRRMIVNRGKSGLSNVPNLIPT